jgi:hypothetical protein
MLKNVVRLKIVYNFQEQGDSVYFPLRYEVSGCHLLDAYDIRVQLLKSKNVILERRVHREITIIALLGQSLR